MAEQSAEKDVPLGWGLNEKGWLRLGVNHVGIPLYRCPECGEEVRGSKREGHHREHEAGVIPPGSSAEEGDRG